MTQDERIARLERLVAKLADALLRDNTEQDGNWGYPSTEAEMREIIKELREQEMA